MIWLRRQKIVCKCSLRCTHLCFQKNVSLKNTNFCRQESSFKRWSRGCLDREVGSYICHLKFVTWSVYIQMMRRHSTCPWFAETYNANNLFCWLGCYSTFQFSSSSPLLKLEASEKGVWVFFFFYTSPDVPQLGSGSTCARSYDMAHRSQTSSASVMTTLDFLCVRE